MKVTKKMKVWNINMMILISDWNACVNAERQKRASQMVAIKNVVKE